MSGTLLEIGSFLAEAPLLIIILIMAASYLADPSDMSEGTSPSKTPGPNPGDTKQDC